MRERLDKDGDGVVDEITPEEAKEAKVKILEAREALPEPTQVLKEGDQLIGADGRVITENEKDFKPNTPAANTWRETKDGRLVNTVTGEIKGEPREGQPKVNTWRETDDGRLMNTATGEIKGEPGSIITPKGTYKRDKDGVIYNTATGEVVSNPLKEANDGLDEIKLSDKPGETLWDVSNDGYWIVTGKLTTSPVAVL